MHCTFFVCNLLLSLKLLFDNMVLLSELVHCCIVDQVKVCRHMMPPDQITTTMLECCKDAVRLAARHKDLNLQAQASHALSGLEALFSPAE